MPIFTPHSKQAGAIDFAQSGNIFAVLFGAVALTGVLAVVGMQTITGPVQTITRVTQKNMIDTHLMTNAKLLIIEASTQPDNRDSDTDGFIEPIEYVPNGTGGCVISVVGGGCLPTTIGATLTDPYGTSYAYCVWDHGPTDNGHNDASVSAPYRLEGVNLSSEPVIAFISAGPDKTFQTGCYAYDGVGSEGIVKPVSSDDIILQYSYAEASASSAGLWGLKVGDPDTAEIAKDLEIKDNVGAVKVSVDSTTGVGDFLGLTTDLITAKTGGRVDVDGSMKISDNNGVTLTIDAIDGGAAPATTASILFDGYDSRAKGLFFIDDADARKWFIGEGYNYNGIGIGMDTEASNQAEYSANAKLVVDIDGEVGIGTASPLEDLEVKATSNPVILLHDASTASYKLGVDEGNSVFKLAAMDNGYGGSSGSFTANDTQVLSMQGDGDVGIGTIGPIARLHVNGGFAMTAGYGRVATFQAAHPTIQLKGGSDTNNSAFIGYDAQSTSEALHFWTARAADDAGGTSTAKMSILANGYVGIGTQSPRVALHTTGDAYIQDDDIYFSHDGSANSNNDYLHYDDSANIGTSGVLTIHTDKPRGAAWNAPTGGLAAKGIYVSGKVGIGEDDPQEELDVIGTVKATSLLLTSDKRFKTEITPLLSGQDGLAAVNALNPVRYYWKDKERLGDEMQIGLLAQDVEKIIPEAVGGNEEQKAIKYNQLIPVLVKAIQDQDKTIKALEKRLNDLENK